MWLGALTATRLQQSGQKPLRLDSFCMFKLLDKQQHLVVEAARQRLALDKVVEDERIIPCF
jgi:hypothetical protein